MNYDVILNANDSTTLETQYAFTQGDYGQIQFGIRVKADGQYISNATRAYIVFSLSNGMIVTGADMQKSVATYTYVFQGNELQSPGKVVADVKLVYANGQISSNKFTFICRYDPLADKSVPAAPYITVLQRIVDEGQEKIDYLQALIDSIQGSIGGTPLTRDDLQNTRSPVSAGIKALDAHMAQYMLLKEDIVNQFLNDPNRPASAALAYTLNSNLANRLIYVSGFSSVPAANIRVAVGQTSVTVPANAESFVINASSLTAGGLTNGENIIGISWYSTDTTSIFPIGFRLSSSNQVAVYLNKTASAEFALTLRYVTYYF